MKIGWIPSKINQGIEMRKCLVCKKRILSHNERALWLPSGEAICMSCEFAEITVYHVTLPGEHTVYYDNDIGMIVEMIKDADFDSGYTVIKKKMRATKYYILPDFEGF